jgi:hypothetical protein
VSCNTTSTSFHICSRPCDPRAARPGAAPMVYPASSIPVKSPTARVAIRAGWVRLGWRAIRTKTASPAWSA